MILKRLTLHDFGAYKGKHVLDLAPANEKRPIILIGGLNGEGKTTILDGLRLALYGKHAECSNRNGQAYEDFLESCINHSDERLDSASVELEFSHTADGSTDEYCLRRTWARRKKGVREKLTVIHNGKADPVLSDTWDSRVEVFLPCKLSKLFFFDGEKIESLADVTAAADFLRTAIGALLGIDMVSLLRADLRTLARTHKMALRTKAEREKLEEAEQNIKQLHARRRTLVAEQDKIRKHLEQQTSLFERLDSDFQGMGGSLYENRNALECEKLTTEEQIRACHENCLDIAAGDLPLSLVEPLLKGVARQAQAEREAELDRAMLMELRERDSKLLELVRRDASGRKLLRTLQKFIKDDRRKRECRAQGTEEYLELPNDTYRALESLTKGGTKHVRDEARTAVETLGAVRERLRVVDEKLAMLPDSERIAETIDKRTKAKVEVMKAQSHLSVLEEEAATLTRMIEAQTARIDKLLEQDADTKHDKQTARRIVEYADKVAVTLDAFQRALLVEHVGALAEEIHECFMLLLRKRNLVARVEIDPETLRIRLHGRSGRIIPQEKLSAGERQLLAVSIVWGLSRASGRPIPAVVDTPLGRLDSSHRQHLVKHYFPYASHQVILLSTDEEIDEDFHRRLRRQTSVEYRVVADDKTQASRIEQGYFW